MKKPRINNQIRVRELRIIDEEGKNIGVMSSDDAILKAKELALDLIEISPNAKPPIAKIMDYGKFQYLEKKKIKEAHGKSHTTETKNIQVGVGTSDHDLQLKSKRASEFLSEKNRVKIDLILKGRAKYMDKSFIDERLKRVLNFISVDYKIADGPKKAPRGISVILEVASVKQKQNDGEIKDKQISDEETKDNKEGESSGSQTRAQ